ncbi:MULTISPECIES: TadE/TadG family type IV pilus assembly protein [unclassified Pseudomonas]|uniref:TadE/TadG family type IV pilus assembly protein n=1 Tax=unclassified Pseudomonas TaxID=196821 RepID=UPI0025EC99E7|nr:TadE/TadG family type IV pilus assembly protein [Pseudomonas sp. RAC1]MDV9030647.1 TadE/TadG family type IV pilus assembly protein [Pseudomonas sp. RAC1]
MQASPARRQKGAAAIEFVAVFLLFFAVFYGLVSYALPMLMLQSFHHASSEAVRRCVALDPASSSHAADVQTLARQVVARQLSWMPAALDFQPASDVRVTLSADKVLTVVIDYPKRKLTRVLPLLVLPMIGEVPRLPQRLHAEASVQL